MAAQAGFRRLHSFFSAEARAAPPAPSHVACSAVGGGCTWLGCADGTVLCLDAGDLSLRASFQAHHGAVHGLAWCKVGAGKAWDAGRLRVPCCAAALLHALAKLVCCLASSARVQLSKPICANHLVLLPAGQAGDCWVGRRRPAQPAHQGAALSIVHVCCWVAASYPLSSAHRQRPPPCISAAAHCLIFQHHGALFAQPSASASISQSAPDRPLRPGCRAGLWRACARAPPLPSLPRPPACCPPHLPKLPQQLAVEQERAASQPWRYTARSGRRWLWR